MEETIDGCHLGADGGQTLINWPAKIILLEEPEMVEGNATSNMDW